MSKKRSKPQTVQMREHLLADEPYLDFSLACNLTLLARDIFPEEILSEFEFMGAKLNHTVDTLDDPERMVIVKYYGLIGPKYSRKSLNEIAVEHNTSSYRLKKLKTKGLKELAGLKRQAAYRMSEIKKAKEKDANPEKFVELSRLYLGFTSSSLYYALRRVGIEYIYQLATSNLDKVNDDIEKTGIDFRYCELADLVRRAQNFKPSERELDTVILKDKNGLWLQTVNDLEGMLTSYCVQSLKGDGIETISDFMNANRLHLEVATANFLDFMDVCKVRKELGFAVETE